MISNTDPEDINQYIYIQLKIPQGYNGFLSRIQGDGNNHYAYTRPDEIRINGNIQNGMIYEYEFTEPINVVHLIWKNNVINKCCFNMFGGCGKILEIDFSHFNLPKPPNIQDTGNMFWDCKALSSINFSGFDTSEITCVGNMFHNCISLTSLNLSNFITSKLMTVDNMFTGCENLKIIDFPNLILSGNVNLDNIFSNCKSLEYLNIRNYISDNNYFENNYNNYFQYTPRNLTICTNNPSFISVIQSYKCHSVNCENNWYDYKKKINREDDSCTDNCTSTNYKYEYNYECYPSCLPGTYNDNYKCKNCHLNCKECYGPNENNCLTCKEEKYLYLGKCVSDCQRSYYNNTINNQKMCKCELPNCYSCNAESFNKGLCINCEEEYYQVYDEDINNINHFKNCSQLSSGYYLENNKIYKKCYESCKKCDIVGNNTMHNCKECKHEYYFEIDYGITKNCYDNCTYLHYFNETKNTSFCTTSFNCPMVYDKVIYEKKECVSNCIKDGKYKYEFRKRCYEDCPLLNSTK
jgi:surface protein